MTSPAADEESAGVHKTSDDEPTAAGISSIRVMMSEKNDINSMQLKLEKVKHKNDGFWEEIDFCEPVIFRIYLTNHKNSQNLRYMINEAMDLSKK
uniref:Uncharacterized protein n=1 Tax=Romanomermis culicivorax TaxID=13658 RepID=A0A915IJX8_ROMCU